VPDHIPFDRAVVDGRDAGDSRSKTPFFRTSVVGATDGKGFKSASRRTSAWFYKKEPLLRRERFRSGLLGALRACLGAAQADERASEVKEHLMDIRSPLVAHRGSAVPRQPRQRALYHPPVPLQPLTTIVSSSRDAALDAATAQNRSVAREAVGLVGVLPYSRDLLGRLHEHSTFPSDADHARPLEARLEPEARVFGDR
jgi:hypothetical protein